MNDPIRVDKVPHEVWQVWAIQSSGQPIGMEMHKLCEETIEKYPEYFEWEHKYKKIPKEVHEEYLDELYPDRHKPIEFGRENFEGYVPPILGKKKEYKPIDHTPTSEDWHEMFKFFDDIGKDKLREEKRQRSIWNKHYKKYKLSFRKP